METFQSMFAAYGLLKEMVSDRKCWVKDSGSAAYLSVSVGSAGHFVETFKSAVEKNEEPAPHHSIANSVSLDRTVCHKAPAELMLNRQSLI